MAERNDMSHKVAEVLRAFIGKGQKKYFTSALILAAGSSTRMGDGVSKQFLSVGGIPVVARTIQQFDKSEFINEIIVVCKKDEIGLYNGFADQYGISTPMKVIEGGSTRQESARFGSDAVDSRARYIAIHDAATITYLLHPEWFTARKMHVEVDCSEGRNRGMTVCEFREWSGGPKTVDVLLDAKFDLISEFWMEVLENL